MRPSSALPAILLGGALFFAVACSSADEEVLPDPTVAVSPDQSITASATPTESTSPVGIMRPFKYGTGVYRICYADASVSMLGTEIASAPPDFEYAEDEAVFHENGEQYDTGVTLVGVTVYRSDEGKLISGWRYCEDADSIPLAPEGVVPLPAVIVD